MDGLWNMLLTDARPLATGAVVPDPAAPSRLARAPATPLYTWLAESLPTLLIIAGALIVIVVLHGRVKARNAPKPPTLEERFARLAAERRAAQAEGPVSIPFKAPSDSTRAPSAPPRAVPEASSLREVMRDSEELAQRLAIAMDARAERLEALIRQADDRLRRLDLARVAGAPLGDGALIEPRRAEPARTAPAGPRPQVGSIEAEQADPVQRQVFDLADQGMPALDIARRLGQPTGQVELMLALRGR